MIELNDEQKKAVTTGDGYCVVTSVAGSGKTRVLCERVIHLIERGVSPDNIVCLTFTNKAADEMRQRISARVDDASKIWISTFHKLCVGILRKFGTLIGVDSDFTILVASDQNDLIKKISRLHEMELNSNEVNFIASLSNRYREDLIPFSEFAEETTDRHPKGYKYVDIVQEYLNTIKEYNAVDFSGILSETYRLFTECPNTVDTLSKKFKYILEDEAQDANIIQYEIMKLLAKKTGNLFIVGDKNQCLISGSIVSLDTNGNGKKIDEIKVGDTVLTCRGNERMTTARVKFVNKYTAEKRQVYIETRSGHTIQCTHNHKMFVQRGIWNDNKKYFVYLMKKGKGYRIGTSRLYKSNYVKNGNGFSFRCRCEKAEAGWILKYYETEKDARIGEKLFSYKYGIPTEVFVCRDKKTMFVQSDLDNIHSLIDSESGAARIFSDLNISKEYPHWNKDKMFDPAGTSVTFTLVSNNRSNSVMHKIYVATNDERIINKCKEIGLSFKQDYRGADRRKKICEKRYCSAEKTYSIRDKVCKIVASFSPHMQTKEKAKIMKPCHSLDICNAEALSVGDYLPVVKDGSKVFLDEIIKKEPLTSLETFFDLEIEGTHNFVTNGIIHSNSLYSWRGACPDNMNKISVDFPGCKKMVLPKNYRSGEKILKAAQSLIRNNSNCSDVTLECTRGVDGSVDVKEFKTSEEEADFVCRKIKYLHSNGTPYSECAVLYRANSLSKIIEQKCRQFSIPYKIVGGYSFYERKEIKDVMSYLTFLINPHDSISFHRAISTPKRGVGDVAIGKLEKFCRDNGVTVLDAIKRINEIDISDKSKTAFVKFSELFKNAPTDVFEATTYFINESGYLKHVEDMPDKKISDNKRSNLEELISGVQAFSKSDCTVSGFLQQASLVNIEKDEDDVDAVSLMTVHAAKGLEFDTVMVIGAEEGLMPHYLSLSEEKGEEEERRILHVAITRSCNRLFISYCKYRKRVDFRTSKIRFVPCKPSRFLDELSD